MPFHHFKKGSSEARDFMAKLRAMRGKAKRKENPPLVILSNPKGKRKTSLATRKFIGKKIGKLRREGYPARQSTAIALSMARKRRFKVPRKSNQSFGPAPKGFPERIWRDREFQRELKVFRHRHGANTPVHISGVRMPPGSPKFMTAYGRANFAIYDAPKASHRGKFKHIFGRGGKNKPWLVSSTSKGPRWLGYAGGTFKARKKWLHD